MPSFVNGFARGPGESMYPELWNGLVAAYAPALGFSGSNLFGFSSGRRWATLAASGPSWVKTKFGWAIQIASSGTATNCVATDGGLPELNITGDFTLSVWCTHTGAFAAANNLYHEIVAKNNPSAAGFGIAIQERSFDSNVYVNGWTYGASLSECRKGWSDANFAAYWPVGMWKVITLQLTRTTLRLFDGVGELVTTGPSQIPATSLASALYIGGSSDLGANDYNFPGIIGAVYLWNHASRGHKILAQDPLAPFRINALIMKPMNFQNIYFPISQQVVLGV